MKHFFKPTKGGRTQNQLRGVAFPSAPAPESDASTPQPQGIGGKGQTRRRRNNAPNTVVPSNTPPVQGNPFLQS